MKFYHTRPPISTGFADGRGYDRAMETVYIDELFLLNLAVDYFLLLGTAKLCALPYRRGRFLAGAALGAGWCCASLFPGMGFLDAALMRPVLAMAMTVAAFGGERRLTRCFLSFLGVSALFGGAVYAAALYRGSGGPGPGRLMHLDMRVLAAAFALCWAAVSLVFRRTVKNAERRTYDVTVEHRGRAVSFRALADTGNGLVDPVSGCAVLVAEAGALAGLFSPGEAALLRTSPIDALPAIAGARLIPYAGVDGAGGLLLAFRPDRITVDGETRHDLIAAVAPVPLGRDGYEAIL